MSKLPPPPPNGLPIPPKETSHGSLRDRFKFTLSELVDAFGHNYPTTKQAIGDAPISGHKNNKPQWDVRDVAQLRFPDDDISGKDSKDSVDVRLKQERIKVLKEEHRLRKQKADLEQGKLVPKFNVERAFATAFKVISTQLDTLNDVLEREGLINGKGAARVRELADDARSEMADLIEREFE